MLMLGLITLASVAAGSSPVPRNATTQALPAAGSITGILRDTDGGVLPGATVTAAQADLRRTVVTDMWGAYALRDLPVGSYTLTVTLTAFVTRVRRNVVVRSAETTVADVDLCAASLAVIDWVAPRDLPDLWTRADVVARVEIAQTRAVASDCAQSGFVHTVTIRDLLKDEAGRVSGQTLTFVQEHWVEERTPYAVGQQMIVFLTATPRGFYRVAGPQTAFLIADEHIIWPPGYSGAAGRPTVAEFLARLRALRKIGK